MCNYFILTGKLSLTTQLAIWPKPRHFALFAHMKLKFLVGEGSLAQIALEKFGVQPRHHDSIDLIVEAQCFRAERALLTRYVLSPFPPLLQADVALESITFLTLSWVLHNIIADTASEFCFERLLD